MEEPFPFQVHREFACGWADISRKGMLGKGRATEESSLHPPTRQHSPEEERQWAIAMKVWLRLVCVTVQLWRQELLRGSALLSRERRRGEIWVTQICVPADRAACFRWLHNDRVSTRKQQRALSCRFAQGWKWLVRMASQSPAPACQCNGGGAALQPPLLHLQTHQSRPRCTISDATRAKGPAPSSPPPLRLSHSHKTISGTFTRASLLDALQVQGRQSRRSFLPSQPLQGPFGQWQSASQSHREDA